MNPNLLLLVAGAAEEAQRARLMNARREVYADFIDKFIAAPRMLGGMKRLEGVGAAISARDR